MSYNRISLPCVRKILCLADQSCQQDNLTDEQQDACHLTGGQASEYAASVTDDAEGRGIGGECCSM